MLPPVHVTPSSVAERRRWPPSNAHDQAARSWNRQVSDWTPRPETRFARTMRTSSTSGAHGGRRRATGRRRRCRAQRARTRSGRRGGPGSRPCRPDPPGRTSSRCGRVRSTPIRRRRGPCRSRTGQGRHGPCPQPVHAARAAGERLADRPARAGGGGDRAAVTVHGTCGSTAVGREPVTTTVASVRPRGPRTTTRASSSPSDVCHLPAFLVESEATDGSGAESRETVKISRSVATSGGVIGTQCADDAVRPGIRGTPRRPRGRRAPLGGGALREDLSLVENDDVVADPGDEAESWSITSTPAWMRAAVARTWSTIASDSVSLMPDVGSSSSRNSGDSAAARANSSRRWLP